MTQDAQALLFGDTLRLQHQSTLQSDQAGVREIERDGEPDNVVRVEPLLRKPDRWPYSYSAIGEFSKHLLGSLIDQSSFEPDRQVTESGPQQLLIREAIDVRGDVRPLRKSLHAGDAKT